MECKHEGLNVPVKTVKEKVIPEISQRDLSDTQNEFYVVDNELRMLVKDMTLKQRLELNKVVSDFRIKLMV